MRTYEKNNSLALLETILEGVWYVKERPIGEANAILCDCKEGLEAMLYLLRGEDIAHIGLKKAYMEINQLICDIEGLEDITCNMTQQIQMCIERIQEAKYLIEQIEAKLEIVFMPYKASMWDSMESIWKTATKDPQCICHVVPIPYYELDGKGGIVKACYEGNDFPKGVPITAFEKYNLEKSQPDIIYIHNPYDELNYITRVMPYYFSTNLLNYTDMLVYVPYYIDGSYKDILEHRLMSTVPGAINATRIIAQSSVHKELFVGNGCHPDKVLDLGSPKFDAVVSAMKIKEDIPRLWEDIIKDKKVFLLSTGITNLLQDEKWLNDIEKIVNSFIDKHSEYVLIWRQHPLTNRTIETMRPNLRHKFTEIMQVISNTKNIMIDMNCDVYPAISVSDALISDYSSILFMYMMTQRPVLGLVDSERLDDNRYYTVDYRGNYFMDQDMDINAFVQMVLEGKDPKKQERMRRFHNSIANTQGTCGEQIHYYIKSEVLDKNNSLN